MDNLLPIIIALLGGAALGMNRAFLGKLGATLGAPAASVINHIGGAIFIFIVLVATGSAFDFNQLISAPSYAYIGGLVGALFVALVSWLIPKAGVMRTTILIISGQILLSTIIDFFNDKVRSIVMAGIGLTLILCGVIIGEYRKMKNSKS
ncbi:DMT family transporter [Peredibacter starrii]|uniref:DMT family transporter n=1 Tax=Peredibacter starrii TaxID=28202 RepID=A0AAX4HMY6_9BACT|nr:DMT family transporter [Peredibacter starrii]WPU64560.1 DMT family transporter [Peredibacter starrii]